MAMLGNTHSGVESTICESTNLILDSDWSWAQKSKCSSYSSSFSET